MSDFSIRLGNDVPPVCGNFMIEAQLTGPRDNEFVTEFVMLDRDIDSDIIGIG